MFYYAISDIHGYYNILKETMNLIDLKSDKENKLIFLGDYIDYGNESLEVLYYIKALSEEYENQVIVLRGNHEETFLEKLSKNSPRINTFKNDHKELISWLKRLPYYFQTERQIFVHAGIIEEAGDLWMHGTPREYFVSKYPAETGYFYKDIIAGHVSTSELRNNTSNHEVYWDGQSHYYIDGTVQKSGIIPVLKYDTETGIYTSFCKIERNGWKEYNIKSSKEEYNK